jgi:hypothetical protein
MKRHEISRLLEAYRGAVNFYVRSPLGKDDRRNRMGEMFRCIAASITRAMAISLALETS